MLISRVSRSHISRIDGGQRFGNSSGTTPPKAPKPHHPTKIVPDLA